jgi:hypothetical protein
MAADILGSVTIRDSLLPPVPLAATPPLFYGTGRGGNTPLPGPQLGDGSGPAPATPRTASTSRALAATR